MQVYRFTWLESWGRLTELLFIAFQNHGIGTELLRRLQKEAMRLGVPVRLRVLKKNKALQLYERLDFAVTGETDTHMLKDWAASKTLERTQ